MRVRHMSEADIVAVAELLRAPDGRAYAGADGAGNAEITPATLERDLARAHAESYVALGNDGAIVGHAHARVRRGALWLDRLTVARDAGRSEAADLVRMVVVNYVGDPAIFVRIADGDRDARRFFEEEGFLAAADLAPEMAGEAGSVVMRRLMPRA